MCSEVMKGLRFANTQETCFEAWKRSHMGSAFLEGGRSAYIHEFCYQTAKRSDMDCVELQGCLFSDSQEIHFQVS